MSAVGAAPDALAELGRRLGRQADDQRGTARRLGRTLDEVHAASGAGLAGLDDLRAVAPTLPFVLAAAPGLTTTVDELVRSIDELARFVTGVADALAHADGTLARVGEQGGTGTSPWTDLGRSTGTAQDRRYARGVRRTGAATFAGPLRRSDRTRQVQVGSGSVRDGWGSTRADVNVVDLTRTARAGRGAGTRFGSERAHVDVDSFAGAALTGRVTAGVGDANAHVSVSGRAEAGAHVRAAAFAGSGMLGVGGGARAFVGAQASGEVRLGVGRSGLDAELDAHALLGGEAEVDGEVDVLGVRTTGHAGVSYGVGAELVADAHVGLEKIELRFDVGATVGLGVSMGFDVSLSPRAVAGGVVDVVGGGASAAKSGVKKVVGWFWSSRAVLRHGARELWLDVPATWACRPAGRDLVLWDPDAAGAWRTNVLVRSHDVPATASPASLLDVVDDELAVLDAHGAAVDRRGRVDVAVDGGAGVAALACFDAEGLRVAQLHVLLEPSHDPAATDADEVIDGEGTRPVFHVVATCRLDEMAVRGEKFAALLTSAAVTRGTPARPR